MRGLVAALSCLWPHGRGVGKLRPLFVAWRTRAGRRAQALVPPALAAGWLLLGLAACEGPQDDLLLVGTLERTEVEVVSPVSERILTIDVAPGESVTSGTVLVRLDPTLPLAALARAEADLAGARTQASVSASDYRRAQKLKSERVISEQKLDQAKLEHEQAAAQLWAAEAAVVAARRGLADHTLVSPVDGVVDQLPYDEGERVPAGAVLAVLLREGPPWVRVWLPERAFARVGPGTEAEVRIDGVGHAFSGKVLDVAREPQFTPHYALTERERVYLVFETRVQLGEDAAGLRPGMPAEVRLLPADGTRPQP